MQEARRNLTLKEGGKGEFEKLKGTSPWSANILWELRSEFSTCRKDSVEQDRLNRWAHATMPNRFGLNLEKGSLIGVIQICQLPLCPKDNYTSVLAGTQGRSEKTWAQIPLCLLWRGQQSHQSGMCCYDVVSAHDVCLAFLAEAPPFERARPFSKL